MTNPLHRTDVEVETATGDFVKYELAFDANGDLDEIHCYTAGKRLSIADMNTIADFYAHEFEIEIDAYLSN